MRLELELSLLWVQTLLWKVFSGIHSGTDTGAKLDTCIDSLAASKIDPT
jgi:hypothetical protein